MKDIRECDYARELLSAYRDGELDASERASVEDHLNDCAACREELESVESVVRSLKALPSAKLTKDFSDDIEALIQKSEAPVVKSITRKQRPMWLTAAAAAVVSLLIAGGYYVTTIGGNHTEIATDRQSDRLVDVQRQRPEIARTMQDNTTGVKPIVAETPKGIATESSTDIHFNGEDPKSLVADLPKPGKVVSKIQKLPDGGSTTGGSKTASGQRRKESVDFNDLTEDEALLAFTDTTDGDLFDTEISTDEDGLYAIKM